MLLGFKERFAEPILLGTKVFTLRNKRKNQPKIGETLYMYYGLRSSQCRKITDKEKLMGIQEVDITISRSAEKEVTIHISVDGRSLTHEEIDQFVQFDGFVDRADFADYWITSSHKPKKAPISCTVGGVLDQYHWTDLKY
jgi:hypothetical protein